MVARHPLVTGVVVAKLVLLVAFGAGPWLALPATAAPVYSAVVNIGNLGCFRCGDRKVIQSGDRPVEAEVNGEFNGGQAEARAKAGPGFLEAFGSVENQGPQQIHTLFDATAGDEADDLFFSSPPGSTVEEIPVRLNLHLVGTFGFDAANDDLQTAWVRVEQTGYASSNNLGSIEIVRRDGGTTNINRTGLLANVPVVDEADPSGEFARVIRIDANIMTLPFVVPMNEPLKIGFVIAVGGQQWSTLGLGSLTADFGHTLSFPTDRPVFTLPDGFTANSAAFGIVDNVYVVPEPATAALAAMTMIGGLASGARSRWRRGHPNQRSPLWLEGQSCGAPRSSFRWLLRHKRQWGRCVLVRAGHWTSGMAVARVVPERASPVLLAPGVAARRVRRRRRIGTHSPRLLWLTAVYLALTCFASPAAAANYNFINIADTTQFPFGVDEISLNNQGQVAFLAGGADERFGVFTGDGGPITTIVDDRGEFASFRSPGINDSGLVAFYADYDGPGEGIFTSDGGPVTRIADSLVELPQVILRFPVINSSATVAFRGLYGEFHPARLNFSIHTGTGGPLTLIADSSGPLLTIGAVPLRMNDHGTVAFSALLDSSPGVGIFTGNGGPLTTVVTQAAGFNGFGQPSINNHGTLAFRSQRAGVDGIFTINGGPFVTIADTNGPFAAFSRQALINDEGQVVFRASLDAGGQGIFTGPDPIADKVIQSGDPLFGSTVTVVPGLVTNDATFDLNDRGAVAFVYHLANGTQGIAVARLVPEVTSLHLMLIVAVVMLIGRRCWRLSTILG